MSINSLNSSGVEMERASGLMLVIIEKKCWDQVSFLDVFAGRGSGADKLILTALVAGAGLQVDEMVCCGVKGSRGGTAVGRDCESHEQVNCGACNMHTDGTHHSSLLRLQLTAPHFWL